MEFQEIYEAVKHRHAAVLTRSIQGKTVQRRFIPRERLILLGGGHVAQAVCRAAATLDFSICVVDDRPAFANSGCFPQADEIYCEDFETALEKLAVQENDYVCVLTRGHRHDALCVRYVLGHSMPGYLGMIGSRHRVSEFRQVLKNEGYPQERIDALHAPIGLSIGALTPAEIAISICGELVAHRRREGKQTQYLSQTTPELEVLEKLAQGEGVVLAMVVESTGSTPAKSGAVMAVNRLGRCAGTVGGGCSEAEVIVRAQRLLGTGERTVMEVDLANEVAEEIGMVCGGHMWVYLEDV